MIREVKVGAGVIDQFPAFEEDGVTKRSGLTTPDFSVTVFRNGIEIILPVTITEIGTLGEYRTSVIPDVEGLYEVQVLVIFNSQIWYSKYVAVPETTNELSSRIVGLLHRNAFLDSQVYDSHGQLTSARLRVFDSSVNVPTTPGGAETTGLLHQYSIEASYNGANVVTKFGLKEVL
jgi:hypothetical protein